MRLMPKSLFGRNMLLLAGLIVAAQIATVAMYRYGLIDPRVGRFASLTAAQIRATQQVLAVASATNQITVITGALDGLQGVTLRLQTAPPTAFARNTAWPVRNFLLRLQEELGPGYQTYWAARPEAALWVRITLPQRVVWLGYKGDRLVSDASFWLIAVFVLVTVLALAGALYIQRRLNRPLAQLAQAARRVGQGDLSLHLPTDGPSEIAQVAASFNQMSTSLVQLENDRAIMLAGVSHDLRTPLAKMSLAIELLYSKLDTQLLNDMQRHIEQIDAIIGQFLAYARIGHDEQPQPLNLLPLLQELATDMAQQGVVFEQRFDTLPTLILRPVAIRRVFANLMENAKHYGRAPFILEAQVQGNMVKVCVIDNGLGVAPGSEENIKRPFVRLDTPRATGGSGLGLAIADRVVRLHGGTLNLRNRTLSGFEGRVLLPIHSAFQFKI
jgi:two-component system, OmpR family, osmolarity sensor histidine kinase EnvZ